ncbi:hypothetical protein FSP39_021285 [Pinctada imbricata]|uniref:N-acetylglucosamine-1-phosphotransferase subunits alpha/beta n=1 Tax=Pinctada imbricata TaxID=66713 RepID=A0AA88XVQ5_PINIB|nr:hypothetical protein FSP39_021285 [Pinctada imbricata]
MQPNLKKAFQKQLYDLLSHRYGLISVFVSLVIIIAAAFHFGETLLDWSHEKYAAVFNSFSDNIAEKSFRERLCQPVPIDVVYTWVNGSDPELLVQLRNLKMDMEEELNITSEDKCVFTNCIGTNMVVLDPQLPSYMTLDILVVKNAKFGAAKRMFGVTSPTEEQTNYTVIEFGDSDQVKALLKDFLKIDGQNVTMKRGFITSDWTIHNSILLHDLVIMSGFPHKYSAEELKAKLPDKIREGVDKITLHGDAGLAVLDVPDKKIFDQLLSSGNFSIDGKEPTMNAANLVWDLRDFRRDDDISSSRFEDNEELRYSLRSIERFAPWVRHVYIVTNGQIPHWLNLEYPRVSIVTHQELFPNKTDLPTFSSPAIESHLHRIPGLSQKFIYMNDDVMFGKEVWPDDFFTNSAGQKVYLTWPVPNCNEGCPSSWIRDGYCDKACNNTECEWDGGDCEGQHVNQGVGNWNQGYGQGLNEKQFCNKGCANNWLADRYCDTACNVHNCGYDVGDCGVDKFSDLYQIQVSSDIMQYTVPQGETIAYLNLTSLLTSEGKITSATHGPSDVIRIASVANKFKVITILLHSGYNKTKETFHLKGHRGNESDVFQFNFTLTTETKKMNITKINKTSAVLPQAGKAGSNVTTTPKPDPLMEKILFDVPAEKQHPHFDSKFVDAERSTEVVNISRDKLPPHLAEILDEILLQLSQGELTQKGFNKKQALLWREFEDYKLSHGGNKESKIGEGAGYKTRKLQGLVDIPVPNLALYDGTKDRNDGNRLEAFHQWRRKFKDNHMLLSDEFIDIIKYGGNNVYDSGNPWEKSGTFDDIIRLQEANQRSSEYTIANHRGRHLLDTFGDSLRHVNKLFNKAFGFTPRKVPGHMPHMVDKYIMEELQDMFEKEWAVTSSNKVRSSNDMQFAFSYFYFLMGVKRNVTVEEIFDKMDTDKSGILSDREIRTLATRLYVLPLDLQTLSGLEKIFINCSETVNFSSSILREIQSLEQEHYYDKSLPQVSRHLFTQCPSVQHLIHEHFKPVQKYQFTLEDDEEIAFKMVKTNISTVVGQLDDIRKNPKKFICLNDDIDHSRDDAKTVKAILQDFYESVFPLQSKFELPRDYRNRFLTMKELREWKEYRDWLKFWTHLTLVVLVIFTVASFFGDKIEAAQKKYFRGRSRRKPASSLSQSEVPPGGQGSIQTV